MKVTRFWVWAIAAAVAVVPGVVSGQAPVGTAFTYQGQLTDGGSPANGQYDFEFRLCDDPAALCEVGGSAKVDTVNDHYVEDGLFTVVVDFGEGVFAGEARWLQLGVRPWDSTGAYTILTPRQELTPTPYALALPALRTQDNAVCPAVIGGWKGNEVLAGIEAATISGGGDGSYPNRVTDAAGTIGGGAGNLAGDDAGSQFDAEFGTVAGGRENTASASHATVGGGYKNTASGNRSTVPGGETNTASGQSSLAAGQRAQANHLGAFVWSDSTTSDPDFFASTGPNQFIINATGGVGIGTNNPDAALDVVTEDGTAVRGSASAASGDTIGVRGTSASSDGEGVWGVATSPTGYTRGVFGTSVSPEGTGVSGWASAETGQAVGVSARSDSTAGIGVEGWAAADSGVTLGVRGRSASPNGTGVEGWAYADTGPTYGVAGRSDSPDGLGVYGEATATTGDTVGVRGTSASPDGIGVGGYVSGASGSNSGVFGRTDSAEGTGVQGNAASTSGNAHGVYGASAAYEGTGVAGYATSELDGLTVGVYGESHSTGFLATGVRGESTATTGQTYGMRGTSASSQGTGVLGEAIATSGTNYGVYGKTDSNSGYAGYFQGRVQVTRDLGIGRTPTANELEVEGTASKTVAGGWLANSDARIKTEVTRLAGALETIERLRPVRFKYTEEYRRKHPLIEDIHYVNFVAQEYQEAFPDFVKDSGEEGLLQIDAYPASIYAVAAIQELHGLVSERAADLETLRAENAELRTRLAALEIAIEATGRQQEQTGGAR